jgi:hypothetical protein
VDAYGKHRQLRTRKGDKMLNEKQAFAKTTELMTSSTNEEVEEQIKVHRKYLRRILNTPLSLFLIEQILMDEKLIALFQREIAEDDYWIINSRGEKDVHPGIKQMTKCQANLARNYDRAFKLLKEIGASPKDGENLSEAFTRFGEDDDDDE